MTFSQPHPARVPLEATHLRDRRWAVRPVGACGTCGFSPVPWCVQYVNAASADEALRKAKPILGRPAVNEECFE